ncbi:NUDIX hydrolase [Lichenihabitans sp. Uapishka_5]|uniref:NUDIX hydrolase n=1 Tax=Lichenihabitans sp. Uapishka_5 TaxID=3037302 RepID=UPI0029E81080|nr:NUDIX hydrolase [Lichenihabitans sp. Uapishka_5]MDX7950141.1 NUDIX hydrolase [Lichenihabitans sp. Uapishka_5]
MTVTIEGRKEVYRGWTTIHKLTLSDGAQTFTREVEDHGTAVAVLPYDPERRVVLLVSMPRAPVLFVQAPALLEVPAGLIEPGEAPEAAIRREAEEEAGVRLGTLEFVATLWSCPGLSTERISLYLAPYGVSDRTGPGGGLLEENENITVVETPLADLTAILEGRTPADMKTFALSQALRLRCPHLFD